jgi:DNA polymerase
MPRKKFITAAPFLPAELTIPKLRSAAANCRGCDLWKRATQTVFGQGAAPASVMLVGEQPGDKEDLAGHPFVGPAGKLLDEALIIAGIDKSDVYITNAVKHFNWAPDPRGKRRIHKKPRYSEIQACRPWLEAEISAIRPRIIVCLGATAAQALLGKEFSVMRQRGKFVPSPFAPRVMATVHPSSILRAQDDESRREQKQAFIRDLALAARELQAPAQAA